MKLWRIQIAFAGIMAIAALAGCNGNGGSGSLRIVDASTNAGAVDVYLGSRLVAQNVTFIPAAYPGLSYLTVPKGTQSLAVYPAGTVPASTSPLVSAQVTINTSLSYTVVLTGLKGNATAPLNLLLLNDNNADPGNGKVRLRVIHAAPLSPAVNTDVYVTAPNGDISSVGPQISSLPYLGSSYLVPDLNTGTYRMRFTQSGTKTVLNGADLQGVDLTTSGVVRTVILVGDGTPNAPVQLGVLKDRLL